MTDEMIIKGLECIAREEIKCAECAYGEYCYPVCQNLAGGDALDLIKRQKAEIEDKSNRLREILPMVADIRDGAIKDFAERLVHTLVINNEENTEFFDFSYTLETIDNLVKEMIGEQDESIQQEDC